MEDIKECKICLNKKSSNDFRINRKTCKDCEREKQRLYRRCTTKSKEWAENNREKMAQLQHDWYENNKSEIRNKFNERYKTDENFKKVRNHRKALSSLINGKSKTTIYLNCNRVHLLKWLQFQFKSDMTLDNYAILWNIDHVIPLDKFLNENYSEPIIFHYLNIQPILKKDNLKKNKHWTVEQCMTHLQMVKAFCKQENIDLTNEYILNLQLVIDSFLQDLLKRETPKASDTTSIEKSIEGTRLIAEPNGNKAEDEVLIVFETEMDNPQ